MASERKSGRLSRIEMILGAGFVAAVSITLVVFLVPVRSRAVHTCLQCRAWKVEEQTLLSKSSQVKDSKLTSWYRDYGSVHDHTWIFQEETSYTIYGISSIGCGFHPILYFPPEMELALAENAPEEFRAFQQEMLSVDKQQQRKLVSKATARAWEFLLKRNLREGR